MSKVNLRTSATISLKPSAVAYVFLQNQTTCFIDDFCFFQRNELVVSVRKDIDVSPILGEHIHSRFLKHRSQQSQARKSIIRRASYATEDEIENRGEGWRPNDVPTIPLASVRRNFMEPYPLPIQHHDQNKQDTKGSVKQEMKPEIGIKPDPGSRPAMKQEGESTLPTEPTIRTSIKPEPLDVKPIVKQETNAASSSVIFNSESQTHLYGQEPIDIKPKISDSPQASSSTPNSTSTTRPAVTVKKGSRFATFPIICSPFM